MGIPHDEPAPAGYRVIYVSAFRHAGSGRIIRAQDYGKRAFRLVVPIVRRRKSR